MTEVVEPVERWLSRVDRVAGGRHARYRVPRDGLVRPRTLASFRVVTWLLVAELVLGAAAVGDAAYHVAHGHRVTQLVWMRLVVIFAMTATLFYFVARARVGLWWAYSRLRLFAKIFPLVALVSSTVPGLYPGWMVVEQVAFALVLVVVAEVLSADGMRAAFPRPVAAPAS